MVNSEFCLPYFRVHTHSLHSLGFLNTLSAHSQPVSLASDKEEVYIRRHLLLQDLETVEVCMVGWRDKAKWENVVHSIFQSRIHMYLFSSSTYSSQKLTF